MKIVGRYIKTVAAAILLAVTFATEGKADDWVFQIGGGLASHYGGSTRNIGAFRIGVGYDFRLNSLWSIEPSLHYYAKGWKNKDREVPVYDDDGNYVYDDDGNPLKGMMSVTSNTNYIELPVLFRYKWETDTNNCVLFSFGPYVAYGIGGKTKVNGDTEQSGVERFYYTHPTFSQKDMRRFDAGATVGVAYRFSQQFEVGVSCDFGLTKVSKQGGKNIAALLTLAYRL